MEVKVICLILEAIWTKGRYRAALAAKIRQKLNNILNKKRNKMTHSIANISLHICALFRTERKQVALIKSCFQDYL